MVPFKKQLIFILTVFFGFNAFSQNNSASSPPPSDQEILTGVVSRKHIQQGDFGKFFKKEYRNYKPDPGVLNQIKTCNYPDSVTVVMGTWCSDSRLQVPRFYKIIDKANWDTRFVKLICVNKNKKAESIDIEDLNISKIPTFIFYKNGVEKGRIVESPENTLEKDILNILLN